MNVRDQAAHVAGYVAAARKSPLAGRDAEAVRDDLRQCSALLHTVDATRTELYEWRLELLRDARGLTPPITQRELAELTGVSEAAIIKVLQKARATANGA